MYTSYSQLFAILDQNLSIFINEVLAHKSTNLATDQWTVKDVLCHIVFWHEQYAANYQSLAQHKTPVIPQLFAYKLNHSGVASLRRYSTRELIGRLQKANQTLYQTIVIDKVPQMTYNLGGRVYQTDEFLDMVARHIATHTKHIKRSGNNRMKSKVAAHASQD